MTQGEDSLKISSPLRFRKDDISKIGKKRMSDRLDELTRKVFVEQPGYDGSVKYFNIWQNVISSVDTLTRYRKFCHVVLTNVSQQARSMILDNIGYTLHL